MSKTLYILRHAKASSEPYDKDISRPLADRGREDAAVFANWSQNKGFSSDLALVSTAVRTQQTAEIVLEGFSVPHRQDSEKLYLASVGELFSIIQEQDDSHGSLLIIGHNPGIYELCLTLSAHPALDLGFPTSAFAALECDIPYWGDIMPDCGDLRAFWTPKQGDSGV